MTAIEKLLQSLDWIVILVQSPFASLVLFGLLMLYVTIRKNRRG